MAHDEIDERDLPDRLRRAAKLIADQAKVNAAGFSRRIPAATRISGATRPGDDYVEIVTNGDEAPNASPFEDAEWHPLWGNKRHEYQQPHRPYMEDAVNQKSDAAVNEIANVIDDWAADLGFDD